MRFLPLTFLYFLLNGFSNDRAMDPLPSLKVLTSTTPNANTVNDVEPGATNILFQSKDGGQTWQDISEALPENEQPEGFFAGGSDVYLRVKGVMYRSKSNLDIPVWEREDALDPQSASITFSRSGIMAYNYEGQVYQKMSEAETWSSLFPHFKKYSMRNIFEAADGSVFTGYDDGLFKSTDKGKTWKQVHDDGGVGDMLEAEGVLIAAGRWGIMRSTDNGEHWNWVIREGGVGIAIERIKGGFAAITYSTTSESRRVRISLDNGRSWNAIDEGLRRSPFTSSIKQIGGYLFCGHPDGIFRSSDMGKTWNKVRSTVDKKVFKIYVSGSVVYAVAGNAGC